MSAKKGEGNRKSDILISAKVVFSSKGYDAATMDEIAGMTGVPKSLIYYHFQSKEKLLQAVIDCFFEEYQQLLRTNMASQQVGYMQFLYDNTDFLRVIIAESLKDTGNGTLPSIFRVVELLMNHEFTLTGNTDILSYGKASERWIAEFFTSIIPCALFACYKDKWSTCFQTDPKTLEQDFAAAYEKTHGEYHRQMEDMEDGDA